MTSKLEQIRNDLNKYIEDLAEDLGYDNLAETLRENRQDYA